jgi:hypothetical protein
MFKIHRSGGRKKARLVLVARAALTPTDFHQIADAVGGMIIARKAGCVAARRARKSKVVETRWNGKETTNTAQPGDWIVTTLSASLEPLRDSEGHANTYVISGQRFGTSYERTGSMSRFGTVYRPINGVVEAIPLLGGFDIVAPWGERQKATCGYLLLNGIDVYGNNWDIFAATYEIVRRLGSARRVAPAN